MKREEAETIKREAYESLIGMYDNRANMFPAHSELVIHIVAGDLQQLCALAHLGLRVKWPSEEDEEAMARASARAEFEREDTWRGYVVNVRAALNTLAGEKS